jgi:hypothetical protein
MAYGLIKDTTLTALADGFREKGIIPETREAIVDFDYQLYKTDNITSDTNPIPVGPHSSSSTLEYNISIPEATKLEFRFKLGIKSRGPTENRAGSVVVWSTSNQTLLAHSVITDRPAGEEYTEEFNLVVEDNAAIFKINRTMVDTTYSPYFGLLAEVYPLDADGNVIPGLFPREATVVNTVTPEAMAEAINAYEMPIEPPEKAFYVTGDCSYRFAYGHWDWFLEAYGSKMKTVDISNASYMFSQCTLPKLPFVLNVKDVSVLLDAFSYTNLRECPKIRGSIKFDSNCNLQNVIHLSRYLRDVEDLFEPSMLDGFSVFKVTSAYSTPKVARFYGCYSLRRIPSWWYKFKLSEESTAFPTSTYALYYMTFTDCSTLDEATNIPVWTCNATQTGNMFSSTFNSAHRIKSITFETNKDGTPIETMWKSQTIDMTANIGYLSGSGRGYIIDYNSGITADKEVKDDATYQALKNDPDWFATKIEYSRYNHDSAVETINSLPDTSAYLATAGGTNTIKFKGASGSLTDGGAINTLTAEEIAVAAAKGWTVTLV